VTRSHATVITHLYVFKKKKKLGHHSEEVEDPSLEFQDAIEEDLLCIVKLARPKNKCRRKVLNLNSSINYGDASMSSPQRKGKARLACFSVYAPCRFWVEGLFGFLLMASFDCSCVHFTLSVKYEHCKV
jgi:hypothetical protein